MSRLESIIELLETAYGTPTLPLVTHPFEMILLENVAYLVDDARRQEAFDKLKRLIGTRPFDILQATPAELNQIAVGGINFHGQIEKLIKSAKLAQKEFNGDLAVVVAGPVDLARKALKKFPAIGDPSAEKILLFNRRLPVLALESNGLRVMTRLGYGEESSNYAAMYRSAQAAAEPEMPREYSWLIKAHQLLRRHGKEQCKRTAPRCERCPVKEMCHYFETEIQKAGL